jgi:UrcA family protein
MFEPCPGRLGRNLKHQETLMKTPRICFNPARVAVISAGIAVLCCAGTGSLAWAAEPIRIDVSYADLNIESAAGVKSLYGRLRFAAQRVCAPLDDGRGIPGNFRYQNCYKTALDSAVGQINKPVLTAMHQSRGRVAGG